MLVLIFVDINECDGSHGCEHRCINTQGSFKCACLQDGYRLGPDGTSCKGKPWWPNSGFLCNYVSCSIHHSCIDVWSNLPLAEIDECAEGIHNCDQICHNTDGSFTCSCRQGYQLARDRTTCLGENVVKLELHPSMHSSMNVWFTFLLRYT